MRYADGAAAAAREQRVQAEEQDRAGWILGLRIVPVEQCPPGSGVHPARVAVGPDAVGEMDTDPGKVEGKSCREQGPESQPVLLPPDQNERDRCDDCLQRRHHGRRKDNPGAT